jgi:putative FmdB family regulatory protein
VCRCDARRDEGKADCERDRGENARPVAAETAASLAPLMPIYEYKCPNGHVFESFHGMTEPGPEVCEVCGAAPLVTVLHPVAVHYKGSGFYSTDYGRKSKTTAKDGGGSTSSDSSSSTSSDSGSSSSSGDGEKKKAAEA